MNAALEGRPVLEDRLADLLSGRGPTHHSPAERLALNIHRQYERLPYPQAEPGHLEVRAESMIELQQSIIEACGFETDAVPSESLAGFAAWANASELLRLPPSLRAALVHYHLLRLAPFAACNGVAARLLEARILAAAGIRYVPELLPQFYLDKSEAYREETEKPEAADTRTAFLSLFLECNVRCLEEVLSGRSAALRRLALAEYVRKLRREKRITARERDLILLMLEANVPLTLREILGEPPYNALYRDKTDHTARRDLKRLLALGLLVQEGKTHRINKDIL
jgi:Fic family protein